MGRRCESKLSKNLEKTALKGLKKSFEDEFGSVHKFFGPEGPGKRLHEEPGLSEKAGDNAVKQDSQQQSSHISTRNSPMEEGRLQFPQVIHFLEGGKSWAASETCVKGSPHMSSELPHFCKKNKGFRGGGKEQDSGYGQLKNDIALQRLLRESHWLKRGSDRSAFSLEPVGKQRHKIMENRIKRLGGKEVKEKVPLKIRLGMKRKAKIRSEIAKKKAKEAGVVRALPVSKAKRKYKRNHGLNEIRIGKYHKGMVTLSEKDIRETLSTPISDKKNKRKNNRKFV